MLPFRCGNPGVLGPCLGAMQCGCDPQRSPQPNPVLNFLTHAHTHSHIYTHILSIRRLILTSLLLPTPRSSFFLLPVRASPLIKPNLHSILKNKGLCNRRSFNSLSLFVPSVLNSAFIELNLVLAVKEEKEIKQNTNSGTVCPEA